MIIHVFNSSSVSGPETLVIPALKNLNEKVEIWFLIESRIDKESNQQPINYALSFRHQVMVFNVKSRLDLRTIKELRQKIIDTKPSILHSHDVKASFYIAAATAFLSQRPKIVTTHHGVGRHTLKLRIYERIYRFISALYFDKIYAVSKFDELKLKKSLFMPINKVCLHVNGVNRKKITLAERQRVKKKYIAEWSRQSGIKINPNDFLLGVVGRLSTEKNHYFIINLFNEIQKQYVQLNKEKIYLLIFGTGPLERALKELVHSLNIDQLVLFMGYHEQMPEKIGAIDLLLSFSKNEGTPINIIEAGWAATPVAAHPIGGIKDLLESDREIGILIDSKLSLSDASKKIIEVIKTKDELEKKGMAIQNHIEKNFSEEKWLHKLSSSYKELNQSFR